MVVNNLTIKRNIVLKNVQVTWVVNDYYCVLKITQLEILLFFSEECESLKSEQQEFDLCKTGYLIRGGFTHSQ